MLSKFIRNIFFAFLTFQTILCYNLHSQDSTKIIRPKNDTAKAIFKTANDTGYVSKFFLSEHRIWYLNAIQPDTITRMRFLWLPLKSFDNLFDYLPGYNTNYTDIGQINQLNFNQLDQSYTGLFRSGRPLNDLFDGSIDFNLLSRNEISDVELTNGFGDFLYNYNNGINIVEKQIFQFRPYSEISFWQDRYENLYFDGTYHQNLFRNFNFNFGATKHSYDGRYTNSDFDIWQGRLNLNYAPSGKINMFLYSNYSKIQRGLNGGIDPTQTNVNNNDSLANNTNAIVRKPSASDVRERFDVDFGLVYSVRNSFTKLQLFTDNSFRIYNDSTTLVEKTHWIDYGAKLQEVLNFKINKSSSVISRTEAEADRDLIASVYSNLSASARYFFTENLNLNFKGLTLDGYGKATMFDYFDSKFYIDYGLKADYRYKIDSVNYIGFYGQYCNSNKLPTYQQQFLNNSLYLVEGQNQSGAEKIQSLEGGAKANLKSFRLEVNYGHINRKGNIFTLNFLNTNPYSLTDNVISSKVFFSLAHFELEGSGNINLSSNSDPYFPKTSGNVMLTYHNVFFKKNLEVKGGINSRFWDPFSSVSFMGRYDVYSSALKNQGAISLPVQIKSNGTLDIFIIAKINKAIFGLTLENILNRVVYTTAYYPYMDRGGLLNIISRFNITWYFLN